MTRVHLDYDCDPLTYGRQRGALAASVKGRRGQRFLRQLLRDLDALPEKRLTAYQLRANTGARCVMGVALEARGELLFKFGAADFSAFARVLDIPDTLVAELVVINDGEDWSPIDTDAERWRIVRDWVARNIVDGEDASASR